MHSGKIQPIEMHLASDKVVQRKSSVIALDEHAGWILAQISATQRRYRSKYRLVCLYLKCVHVC